MPRSSPVPPVPRRGPSAARAPLAAAARWLGLALPLAVTLALALHTLVDLDIWLHERVGRDILASGRLPTVNGYSFTAPDHAWTDHEWLFPVVVAALGRGAPAQRAVAWTGLVAALAGTLVVLLWRNGRRPAERLPGPERAAALALPLTFALSLLWVRLEPRPELFSLVALVLLAGWIDAGRAPAPLAGSAPRWSELWSPRSPAGRTFWLTVAWAQFHGFWLLAPGLWLLAALCEPLERRWRGARGGPRPRSFGTPLGALGPALATFAAGALTPNHVHGLLYPFRALAHAGGAVDLRQLVAEMAPLLASQNQLGLTVLAFKVTLAWSALWLLLSAGRVPLWRALLLVAGLAAAAWSLRNLGLCATAFVLAHSGWDDGRPWAWRRVQPLARAFARARAVVPAAGLAGAAALVAVWLPAVLDDRFFLREGSAARSGLGLAPAQYAFGAAARLRAEPAPRPPRIVANLDAASTLVATRAGSLFVDGRTEAYPPDVWREYIALRAGGTEARAILARRRAEAVVLAHAGGDPRLLETLLAAPQWRLAYADAASVLFLPASPGDADPTAATAALLRTAAAALLATPGAGGAGFADRCLSLASLLNRAGLADGARELLTRGLAARPDHPRLLHNLGNQFLARGELAAAADAFRRALRSSPALVDSRINLGVALFRAGDAAGAARAFREATRKAPGRVEAWANQAEARLQLGDRAGARAAFARALRLRPDDADLRARSEAAGR